MEPTNQSKLLTLTVSVEEANLLIAGLGKLPLEASAQLWMKIREQAAQQLDQLAADARQKAQDQMREDIARG
jgi:hypothetical protein